MIYCTQTLWSGLKSIEMKCEVYDCNSTKTSKEKKKLKLFCLNNCHGCFSPNSFELHLNAEVPSVTNMENVVHLRTVIRVSFLSL